MADSTLRLRTQADLKALVEYAAAVKALRSEVTALTDATKAMGGVPGLQGLAPGQTAPGAPATPGAAPGVPAGPPAPPYVPPGGGGRGDGGGPGPANEDDARRNPWKRSDRNAMGFGGGFVQGFGSPDWAHHAYTLYNQEGVRAAGGYLAGTAIARSSSMIQQLGLGNSLEGFAFASGQKFLEVSKMMTQLRREFRETGADILGAGHAMGFTADRAGELAGALGAQIDAFTTGGKKGLPNVFGRYAGFARFMGIDAGTAMERLGGIQQLGGGGSFEVGAGGVVRPGALTSAQLAGLAGQASAAGMGGGRFAEFLSSIQRTMERQVTSSGQASLEQAQIVEQMTRQVFEQKVVDRATGQTRTVVSPMGLGERGQGFQEQFQNVITGGANPAMRVLMMQAMGYGKPGGPGYMEAESRLEAGINDPRNVMGMFQMFQRRGYNQSQTYLALREAGFGALQARQLTQTLGTKEGLARYEHDAKLKDIAEQGSAGGMTRDQALAALRSAGATKDEIATFERGEARGKGRGFEELGKKAISAGEGQAVTIEGMQLELGKHIATLMEGSTKSIDILAGALNKLTDGKVLAAIDSLGTSMPKIAESLAKWADIAAKYISTPPVEGPGAHSIDEVPAWRKTQVGKLLSAYELYEKMRGGDTPVASGSEGH